MTKETIVIQAVQKEWRVSGVVIKEDDTTVTIQDDEHGLFEVQKSKIIYRKKEE